MVQHFRTMEDMERFYYGDINRDMIMKDKDALLSSDTAIWHKILGAKAWSQLTYEANAWAGLPKEPMNRTSWRLETASGVTYPSGGLAEGVASNFTDIADTTHPTVGSVTATPKLVDHGFGSTWLLQELGNIDDDVIGIPYMREQKAKAHVRALSAMLVQDVDTPASNSMESIDRAASSSAECGHCSDATDPDIYGLNRDGATTWDAQVTSSGSAAANLRDLSISLIDGVYSSVSQAGGLPDVIFTRYNTIKVWSSLLEGSVRYAPLGEAKFVPRFGGAAGVQPGFEVGFNVATYNGIPIIPCVDYNSSRLTARTGEIGPINFADTRFLRVAIMRPTQYIESRWPEDAIALNGHGMEGHYLTVGELKCYNFAVQGKVTDIK